MPVKGTYVALGKQQEIKTSFGDIARENEEIASKRRAEKRLLQEKEEARKGLITKGFKEDYRTLSEVITNTESLDVAMRKGLNDAMDMRVKIYQDTIKNPALNNDFNTVMKNENLRNFSVNLKKLTDRYTDYAANVTKGMTEGTMSNWNKEDLNDLDSIFSKANISISVDPDTGLPIASIAKVDNNGEIIKDDNGDVILERIDVSKILDGRGLNNTVNKYNLIDSAEKIGSKLGTDVITKWDGLKETTKQEFNKETARGIVKGLLGTSKSPSDIAKSIWTDSMGNEKKELTDDDMKSIEEFYINKIEPFYNKKLDINPHEDLKIRKQQLAISQQNANTKAAGAAAGTFKVQTANDGSAVNVREYQVAKPGAKGGGEKINGTFFSLPVNSKGKKKEITLSTDTGDIEIDDLFMTDDGEVGYSGRKVIGSMSGQKVVSGGASGKLSTKKYQVVTGGGTQAMGDIAAELGMSYSELKEKLVEAKDSFVQSSGTTKTAEDYYKKYSTKE